MYRAIDVAHWFIYHNQQAQDDLGGEPLSLLKLLKLLYYAEGSYLAIKNKSLFNEDILAWEHGPVVKEVYYAYSDPYNLQLTDEDIQDARKFSKDDSIFLTQVFDVFGQYSAWALRNRTHEESPWIEATNHGKRLNQIISRDTMKKYFRENYVDDES